MRRPALVALAFAACLARPFSAQQQSRPSGRVDFIHDVQPIFETHCYDCHGPERQSNGFRLDRRHAAFRGGTTSVIAPGDAASSKLYLRLLGRLGEQMPKDDTLTAQEVQTIKTWIDQGAEWPDAAAGDPPPMPVDAGAEAVIAALRSGDLEGFSARLAAEPALANRRGAGGSTPLMYAALYADARNVRALLDAGGDPNISNEEGATALMWAAGDAEKVRALVEHGADVNAKSLDGRTPLLIACSMPGSLEAVRFLLDRGAKIAVKAAVLAGSISPLSEAARRGDAEMIKLLLARGAAPEHAGPLGLGFALRSRCTDCFDWLSASTPKDVLSRLMAAAGPPRGPALATVPLLRRGADPNVRISPGFVRYSPEFTMLMLAAASEAVPVEAARELVARGADVNAVGPDGITALTLARRQGQTPLVDMLLQAGGKDGGAPPPPPPAASPVASPAAAIARSLPLLQRADVTFLRKSGCVSCHNNSLTAMTMALARSHGVRVDENVATAQRDKVARYIDDWRERSLQAHAVAGETDTMSYILVALAAEHHPADLATDALARLIRLQQDANGSWAIFANRPPIESSDIQVTAFAVRSLQVYGPQAERPANQSAIARAAAWLREARPRSTEDRAMQLLGLVWTNADRPLVQRAAAGLAGEQRADGGWAQTPTLSSDAYATGEALVGLAVSGVTASEPVYAKGVRYLLRTQLGDGSWFVRTRAIPLQPFMDADFPHGPDQFISAAATNWATQALIFARSKNPS